MSPSTDMLGRYMKKETPKTKYEKAEPKAKRLSPRSNSLKEQAKVIKLKSEIRNRPLVPLKAKKRTAFDKYNPIFLYEFTDVKDRTITLRPSSVPKKRTNIQ